MLLATAPRAVSHPFDRFGSLRLSDTIRSFPTAASRASFRSFSPDGLAVFKLTVSRNGSQGRQTRRRLGSTPRAHTHSIEPLKFMAQQPPTTNHRPPPLPAIITLLRFELARFRSLPAPSFLSFFYSRAWPRLPARLHVQPPPLLSDRTTVSTSSPLSPP